MIVSFPSLEGKESFSVEGAWDPISGAGERVSDVGDIQELSSCWKVILYSLRNVKLLSVMRRLVESKMG